MANKELDGLKLQATMAVQAYQRGREKQAPSAFDALYFIIDNAPDNPTGWLLLGWITGTLARDRATHLESEYDEQADAWYVKVSDKDVDHTTEVVANIDWTRDGELVGIELLPGALPVTGDELQRLGDDINKALTSKPQEEHLTDEELIAFHAKLKKALLDNKPITTFVPPNSCPHCFPRVCDIARPGCHKRAGLK